LHPFDEEEIKDLHQVDMPLIVVGGPVIGCSSVAIDDYVVAEQATSHLISLGHRTSRCYTVMMTQP